MKNGLYDNLKSNLLLSLKFTDITEPTVVVAMAAALAKLGADVLEKSTDLKVIGTAVEPPPQPASDRPASAELSGSKGAPASTWSKERRETLVIFDMLNKGCVGLQIESHNIFVSVVSGESTWCRHCVSSL